MTKDELIKAREWMYAHTALNDRACLARYTIMQALDAQIKACDVPKIEGLGEALKNVLEEYDAETSKIPLGLEDKQKGASVYNWRRSIIADLKAMIAVAEGE
jgi:hypothetical protein